MKVSRYDGSMDCICIIVSLRRPQSIAASTGRHCSMLLDDDVYGIRWNLSDQQASKVARQKGSLTEGSLEAYYNMVVNTAPFLTNDTR